MTSLPHNNDAERAVLGSILMNRDAIVAIAPFLQAGDFYNEKHAWIYEAVLACYQEQTPPDVRTVSDKLRQANRLDAVGGLLYLSDLIDAVPTSYHVEFYGRTVARCAFNRNLIMAGAQIAKIGYQDEEPEKSGGAAQKVLDQATMKASSSSAGLTAISETVDRMYEVVADAVEQGVAPRYGVPSGFRDLDEVTGGFQPSDLIILAARPGVGKTSFVLSLAYNIVRQGGKVGFFSLEMSREQLIQRLMSVETGINLQSVRLWAVNENELPAYMQALSDLHSLPLYIDDEGGLTVTDLRNRVLRHIAQQGPLDLLIIDYLQLLGAPSNLGRRYENRTQEVSEISRALKALAKELHCPVVALSQLSRAVEGRSSHVPMLSDLRESGSLEQDADIVMFIYREELYDKDTDKKGVAELHIAKHRNGPVGIVSMHFDASTTRFSDLSYRSLDGY